MWNEARFVPGHEEVSMRSIPGLLVLPLLLIASTARLNAGTPDGTPILMGPDRGDAGEPEIDGPGQEPAGTPDTDPIVMGAYRSPDSTPIVLGQEPAPTGTTPGTQVVTAGADRGATTDSIRRLDTATQLSRRRPS